MGRRVYVSAPNGVAVVATGVPAAPVLLGIVATGLDSRELVLTHDGGTLYVVNYMSKSVSALTAGANLPQVRRTIAAGRRRRRSRITRLGSLADGDRIYVLNRLDQTVTVIDPALEEVVANLRLNFVPKHAAAGIVPTRP